MKEDPTLHDAELRELAQRLGTRAAERLDVERTAQVVLQRLRTEPHAHGWVWMQPAWLRIAAAIVVLVGTGAVAVRMRTPSLNPPPVATAGGELGDLSAEQLRAVLETVEHPRGEPPIVSVQEVGLEDLSAPQLRALLQSLEG